MLSCLPQQRLHQGDEDILVLMKSPPKLSSLHECLNMLVITFIRSHMTASICSCLARPQYFIIPSPLTPLQHNGCVLANWIIMTQNRLCSDWLPAQAMHNGFSNTTGLIMGQLFNFKYERKRKGPNEGNVVVHRKKNSKRRDKTDWERLTERRKTESKSASVMKEGKKMKKEKNKEAKTEREKSSCPYTVCYSEVP